MRVSFHRLFFFRSDCDSTSAVSYFDETKLNCRDLSTAETLIKRVDLNGFSADKRLSLNDKRKRLNVRQCLDLTLMAANLLNHSYV
jgi:hypothetical protein